jgi:hypothetical protein
MEIRNYITTDFKAIDSQETIATVKDFWWFDFSHFPVVEEGIYIGSISSEDIENFDNDKKVVDYYTLASFFHKIQSRSIGSFLKPYEPHSCFDEKTAMLAIMK